MPAQGSTCIGLQVSPESTADTHTAKAQASQPVRCMSHGWCRLNLWRSGGSTSGLDAAAGNSPLSSTLVQKYTAWLPTAQRRVANTPGHLPMVALLALMVALSRGDPEVDRAALLQQKEAFTNWDALTQNFIGWDEFTPLCNWTHITCTFGEVTQVSLAGYYFTGQLLDSWGTPGVFQQLEQLWLGVNSLSGSLPNTWGQPGAFPKLNNLGLGKSGLAGTLPATWGQLGAFPKLDSLDLGGNRFTGTLPDVWGQPRVLPILDFLDLEHNGLTGSLPAAWGQPGAFANLNKINLRYNDLTGTVPATWGQSGSFPRLLHMRLMPNPGLCGLVPASLQNAVSCLPHATAATHTWGLDTEVCGEGVICTGGQLGGTPCPTSPPPFPPAQQPSPPPQQQTPPQVLPPQSSEQSSASPAQPMEQSSAPPAQLPKQSPAPQTPPASASSTGSSSTPIGAIAGAAIGGLVLTLAAFLAFFAFRPRKGWLRTKALPAPAEPDFKSNMNAAHGGPDSGALPPLHGALPRDSKTQLQAVSLRDEPALLPNTYIAKTLEGMGTPAGGSQPVASAVGKGGPSSSAGAPGTPARMAGYAALDAPGGAGSGGPGNVTPATPSLTSASLHSLASDPLLSYISSYMATSPPQHKHPQAAAGGRALPQELTQWQVRWEDIALRGIIGAGSFGSVYLAVWQETPVAVKVISNKGTYAGNAGQGLELPEGTMKRLQEEVAVMASMRHTNIVYLMGFCTLPACILTEYCSRGSLYDVLKNGSRDREAAAQLTWLLRLKMAIDAATGLLYLHNRSIIHRDVKSPNLLVDAHWNCKVSDFNLSKIAAGQQGASLTTAGASNPMWLAPEILDGERATAASDVYSFGLVMWELMTWRLPWSGVSQYRIGHLVMNGGRPEMPPREALPGPDTAGFAGLDAYCQLISECWSQNPFDRPSFDAIVPRLRALMELAIPAGMEGHTARAWQRHLA